MRDPRVPFFERPPFIPTTVDLSRLSRCRVGVTGATGVLGALLSRRLSDGGALVGPYDGDVADRSAVRRWIRGGRFELMFHLAAVVPVERVAEDPIRALEVNAGGTLNIAAALLEHQPDCWMFLASTSHVYKPQPLGGVPLGEESDLDPVTAYGVTKLAAERLVEAARTVGSLRCCIGRIFSFTDPSQRPPFLVPSLIEKVRSAPSGGEVTLVNAESERDFLNAADVVDILLLLARIRYEGTVNVGSGHGWTVRALAERIVERELADAVIVEQPGSGADAVVADTRRLVEILGSGAL